MLYLLSSFILGTIMGSTSTCIAQQFITHRFNWLSRSRCDHCHHLLHWYDLCPILSQCLLGGRCRYCHHSIAQRYWVIEFTCGCLWFLSSLCCQSTHITDYWRSYTLLFSILLCMSYCDYYTYHVPNRLQYWLSGPIIWIWLHRPDPLITLLCTISLFCCLYGLYFLRPNWIGGADIKLLSLLSLVTPPLLQPYLLFAATTIGLLYCGYQRMRFASCPTHIPFIPCIASGYYLLLIIASQASPHLL